MQCMIFLKQEIVYEFWRRKERINTKLYFTIKLELHSIIQRLTKSNYYILQVLQTLNKETQSRK